MIFYLDLKGSLGMVFCIFVGIFLFRVCLKINGVDTVPVLAGMYHTGTYIGIETLTFRTSLNTGRTGHVPANFGQYWSVKKKNFFFYFIVLYFLNFCKGRMVTYLH